MNKRQKRKALKNRILELADDGREFISDEAKKLWIRDTLRGDGTFFTKVYIKKY